MAKKKKGSEDRSRRCGLARRSFNYAHHIPERRTNKDRREMQECDLEPESKNKVASGSEDEK